MRSIFSYLTRLWIKPQTPIISQKVSLGLFACLIENKSVFFTLNHHLEKQEPTEERPLGCCSAFCTLLFVDFFVPGLGEKVAGIVQGPCRAGSRWSLCCWRAELPSAAGCSSLWVRNCRALWDAPGEGKPGSSQQERLQITNTNFSLVSHFPQYT